MSARILAVDDSMTARLELRTALAADGHRVREAADGHRALAMLAAGAPVDLVITDLYMPGMDGLTLVRRIRRLDRHRATPILVVTIENGDDMRQRGGAAGASAWLVKPWQTEDLRRTVRWLLDKSQWSASSTEEVTR